MNVIDKQPTTTESAIGSAAPLGRIALGVAGILTGLFAGFFVTYQISVTRGLARVDDVTYVQTFQWINRTVQTPEFAVIFFGTIPPSPRRCYSTGEPDLW